MIGQRQISVSADVESCHVDAASQEAATAGIACIEHHGQVSIPAAPSNVASCNIAQCSIVHQRFATKLMTLMGVLMRWQLLASSHWPQRLNYFDIRHT